MSKRRGKNWQDHFGSLFTPIDCISGESTAGEPCESGNNEISRIPVPDATTRRNTNAPIFSRAEGQNPRGLWRHQKKAIRRLDSKTVAARGREFSGLLVIPTGGGKTRTAMHWLLRNVVDKGRKVLWIAHRHELLDQACAAVGRIAYSDVLRDREEVRCRIISGEHDQPVHLQETDDVVIASIHSIRAGTPGATYLTTKWLPNKEPPFVVIDEAHHAPARTYRHLIQLLREHCTGIDMLGLTATPFRTAANEQGHIKAIFPDDIVFSVGLNELISHGILSKPVFISPHTGVTLDREISEADMVKFRNSNFDISTLGEDSARRLAENVVRNHAIVDHYVDPQNRKKYGSTLVFALNVAHAIALNALFRDKGVSSEFVVGNVQDLEHARNISPKENRKAIERFRTGEVEVLINVNILTEGTDLPNIQTIFLARPTASRTLMMQMIGRGLRGPEAEGTKETFIVSFVDDWEEKIEWANPEKLFIEENVDFDDSEHDTAERLIRFVSIDKIEEFARILEDSVDNSALERLSFMERVPIGVYAFSLVPQGSEDEETVCHVLVYSSTQSAFSQFVNDLPSILRQYGLSDDGETEWLDDDVLTELAAFAEREYFLGLDPVPGYRPLDIRNMLQYCYVYGLRPELIEFSQREQFNIDEVARYIYEQGLGGEKEVKYVDQLWQEEHNYWQAFFGFNQKYFLREISIAKERIARPELYQDHGNRPGIRYPSRPLEEFSLSELWESHPDFARQIRNLVFDRSRNADGEYVCAITGKTSQFQVDFEIDHIRPRSSGGLTTPDNLQLVLRRENRKKGSRIP